MRWAFTVALLVSAMPICAHAESKTTSADVPGFVTLEIQSREIAQDHKNVWITGRFLKKGRVALLNYVAVGADRKGDFRATVPITNRQTRLPIEVIDAYGRVEESGVLELPSSPLAETAVHRRAVSEPVPKIPVRKLAAAGSTENLQSPPALTSQTSSLSDKPSLLSTHFFTPSIALSSISYEENIGADISEIAITAKISYWQALGAESVSGARSRWNLGFSGYYTASMSATGESSSISFLGLDGKLGYGVLTPESARGWGLKIEGGAYYQTTFVSTNTYGFKNRSGPELYPELEYTLQGGGVLSAYVKYAPTLDEQGLSFANTEFAGELAYLTPSTNVSTHSWIYTLDVSSLNLNQNGLTAQSKSISLGVGLRL